MNPVIRRIICSYIPAHRVTGKQLRDQYIYMLACTAMQVAEVCRDMGFHRGLRTNKYGEYADPKKIFYYFRRKGKYRELSGRYVNKNKILISFMKNVCRHCGIPACYDHGEVSYNKKSVMDIILFYMDNSRKEFIIDSFMHKPLFFLFQENEV